MAATGRTLAVVERAYRGAVEKQFFDELFMALELHRQLGGLDLLLRGPAVGYAARDAAPPPIRVGRRVVDTLTEPRRDLAALLRSGASVWVADRDLAPAGLSADRLLDGVRPVDPAELAARWDDYRMVVFL